jgi:ketosteroid isomerase-like protein
MAISLYEPEASFVNEGEAGRGSSAIRQIAEVFAAVKPQFKVEAKPTVQSGDIALTGVRWSLTGTDAQSNPLEMSGSSFEVVRRGENGNWHFAIGNPDVG